MCRHRKEKKIRKEFKNILNSANASSGMYAERKSCSQISFALFFQENVTQEPPRLASYHQKIFSTSKVRSCHAFTARMEKRKKTSHHRFLWRCFWKATKKKSSTENTFEKVFASEKIIMKGKKMLFISKTYQAKEILWVSFNTAVVQPAFPSRCSPAVVIDDCIFLFSFRFMIHFPILLIFFAP